MSVLKKFSNPAAVPPLTIAETRRALEEKRATAAEMTQSFLKAARADPHHAYLEVFEDALQAAEAEDARLAAGGDLRPLSGATVAVKDVLLVEGHEATAGSKILEGYKAPYEATAVEKLRAAGAVVIGRTNMDEFAMGSSTENSAYGPTRNPLDPLRVPGGSSGGAAAAVSGALTLAALGSDTGGSIRQPAAFCGLVGLKPTYGRVSRRGLIAMASSLDQIGPLTRTVGDAEAVFNVIKSRDSQDATSYDPEEKWPETPRPFKIGLLPFAREGVAPGVLAAFEDSLETFRAMGHEVFEIDLPHIEYALPCYYVIMPAEASTNLARFDGVRYGFSARVKGVLENYLETRGRGFGREVRRRIILGTYVLSAGYHEAYYGRATKVREAIVRDFAGAFERCDVIVSPTAPTTAFKLGEKVEDPLAMYLSDIFTVSVNIARLPALSLPTRLRGEEGLPVGLQLIAPWWREDRLFTLGKAYESRA